MLANDTTMNMLKPMKTLKILTGVALLLAAPALPAGRTQ
jgi:hypothetical protein